METIIDRLLREEREERIEGFKQGKGLVFAIKPKTCLDLAIDLIAAANRLKNEEHTHVLLWSNGLVAIVDNPYEEHFIENRVVG